MRLDTETCRARLAASRSAVLATTGSDLWPHLVPVTFAVLPPDPAQGDGATWLVTAVDHKPKTTLDLRRLRNIAENPRVAVLCDVYNNDWTHLWWVRADGVATVVTEGAAWDEALDALAAKYPQYREVRPSGPVIRVRVERLSGWAFAETG